MPDSITLGALVCEVCQLSDNLNATMLSCSARMAVLGCVLDAGGRGTCQILSPMPNNINMVGKLEVVWPYVSVSVLVHLVMKSLGCGGPSSSSFISSLDTLVCAL